MRFHPIPHKKRSQGALVQALKLDKQEDVAFGVLFGVAAKEARQEGKSGACIGSFAFLQSGQKDHVAVMGAYRGLNFLFDKRGRVIDAGVCGYEVGKLLANIKINGIASNNRVYIENDAGGLVIHRLNGLAVILIADSAKNRNIGSYAESGAFPVLDAQCGRADNLKPTIN
jgi:hypothetical protein